MSNSQKSQCEQQFDAVKQVIESAEAHFTGQRAKKAGKLSPEIDATVNEIIQKLNKGIVRDSDEIRS